MDDCVRFEFEHPLRPKVLELRADHLTVTWFSSREIKYTAIDGIEFREYLPIAGTFVSLLLGGASRVLLLRERQTLASVATSHCLLALILATTRE
jgi:hypothetical protein